MQIFADILPTLCALLSTIVHPAPRVYPCIAAHYRLRSTIRMQSQRGHIRKAGNLHIYCLLLAFSYTHIADLLPIYPNYGNFPAVFRSRVFSAVGRIFYYFMQKRAGERSYLENGSRQSISRARSNLSNMSSRMLNSPSSIARRCVSPIPARLANS